MIELTLLPHTEALADPNKPDYARLKAALNGPQPADTPREPLYHQWLTYQMLRQAHIVTNSYNTGTGKTQAALLYLLDLAEIYQRAPTHEQANVLFIAPTNELLRQHAGDVREFVARNNLPYQGRVLALDAATIRKYGGDYLSDTFKRQSKRLEILLANPAAVLPDAPEGRNPYVLVTNPDIFYYALYGLVSAHERNVLFGHFLGNFKYIIIDEFHYYNAKQFANFLFFFTLLREWNYFAQEGRRICLLTATPTDEVARYMARLATSDNSLTIAHVVPGEEPPNLRRVPALAPVRLHLHSAEELTEGLVELAGRARGTVEEWLAHDQHGAIISSALWRINRIYEEYGGEFDNRVQRLTGPEREKGRKDARLADLMLATPTVDIGYNFERPGKTRQSIDFLLFDTQHADEFIQRLGRAGRVLGKTECDRPSDVWVVAPDKLLTALREHAGQSVARDELTRIVKQTLAPRNGIYGYVRTGAIAEAFLPIYNIQRAASGAEIGLGEELFEAVKQVYATTSKRTFKSLMGEIWYYQKMRDLIPGVIREARSQSFQLGVDSVQARFMTNQLNGDGLPGESNHELDNVDVYVQEAVHQFRQRPKKREAFIRQRWEDIERYYAMEARFNFRDSYQPPQVVIYDPQHLLSSEDYNVYSAVHIAQNFVARWSTDASRIAQWKQKLSWLLDEEIYICCTIEAGLEHRLLLQLSLGDPGSGKKEWESRYLSKVVALSGFRLLPATDTGGKVPGELNDILAENYFAFYAVLWEGPEARALNGLKQTTSLFTNKLVVDFGDEATGEYLVVLGSAALMVTDESTVRSASYASQRADKGAIIC